MVWLGFKTRDSKMEGADESTEQWLPPSYTFPH